MARYRLHGYSVSLAAHAAALVIVGVIVGRSPERAPTLQPQTPARLVWAVPGPGSIGGGGPEKEASRPAQRVGADALSLPSTPEVPSNPARPPSEPAPHPVLPSPQVASGLMESLGAVAGPPGAVGIGDPGEGPGTGGGRGRGIGPETGDRIGGGGDDGVQPGNGVSWPKLVREVKPNYTADAMRAQVEGMVALEIVVLPDGSVGRVSLVRSLDGRFGLDQEAIKAVRAWRFEPGRRLGKAIPVRVGVEVSFNLR